MFWNKYSDPCSILSENKIVVLHRDWHLVVIIEQFDQFIHYEGGAFPRRIGVSPAPSVILDHNAATSIRTFYSKKKVAHPTGIGHEQRAREPPT